MMLPSQAKPVTRSIQPPLVRAAFFKPDFQKVFLRYTPQGEPVYVEKIVTGSHSNPNEPVYFRPIIAAENWCNLFAGFSQAQCLAMHYW